MGILFTRHVTIASRPLEKTALRRGPRPVPVRQGQGGAPAGGRKVARTGSLQWMHTFLRCHLKTKGGVRSYVDILDIHRKKIFREIVKTHVYWLAPGEPPVEKCAQQVLPGGRVGRAVFINRQAIKVKSRITPRCT